MIKAVILDDEEWIRKLIKKIIPFNRYPLRIVGEAADAIEGLAVIRRCRPEIVLTDIRMPRMTGLELIREIQKENAEAIMIIISGYSDFEYARTALKLGVTDYILKPIEEEELDKALSSAVKEIAERKEQRNREEGLSETVRRLSASSPKEDSEKFSAIGCAKTRRALQFIHENFNRAIGLDDAADCAAMNSAYFSTVFKEEVGVGFNRYLNEIRLKHARRLLEEHPELSVAKIAHAAGFQDPNYFSRVFRRHFGTPPQELREIGKIDPLTSAVGDN